MRIATDEARRHPISPRYGRPRTGAKGIGRFAGRRLSQKLILSSLAERDDGERERIEVVFDWDEFKPGKNLDEIANIYTRETIAEDIPTGVTLVLKEARDIWDEDDVAAVQRDLLELINPFPDDVRKPAEEGEYESDPGFSLEFEAPEFPKYEGKLGDRFLKAAWGILTGDIDQNGTPCYELKVQRGDTFAFQPAGFTFPRLRNARLEVHYVVYRSDVLRALDFNVRDARALGRERGGVRIYLDEFRVFSYGDPGDDWLDLDADRARRLDTIPMELRSQAKGVERPMLLLPGNMQLFGAVSLSRLTNPDVHLNISRERLVENEAFAELKKFVRLGIDWMTIQYTRVTAKDRARRAKKRVPAVSVTESLATVRKLISEASDELEPGMQAQVMQAVTLAETAVKTQEEERISELSMLRVLASAGTMVLIFEHTLRALISGLEQIHTDLSELQPRVSARARKAYDDLLNRFDRWKTAAERQALQVGLLLGREARERRRRLVLRPVIKELNSAFKQYMQEYGIEFANAVPAHLRTPPMFEAELHSILINLLTNALKAVRTQPSRRIEVTASREDDGLHLFMRDTGVGLDPSMREEVFEPFVTTSLPDPLLGVGTGLGLKIVRDLVEAYGGKARFVDVEAPWKTCVEIILPEG
jgi:signal transduction histidine kinase